MAHDTQSYIDMLRKFGSDLGLPKPTIDKLIEINRENIEALGRSAQTAAEGATSMVGKQREMAEAGFRDASDMVRELKPMGSPREALSRQTEFATKVFDLTLQYTRDIAQLATRSTAEAVRIIQERLRDSIEEVRGTIEGAGEARKE